MRPSKDVLSGLLFIAFGIITLAVASQYRLGTAMAMGPGFFPIMVGSLITFCGVITVAKGIAAKDFEVPEIKGELKPLAMVVASILSFGLLIERAGLVVSVAVMIAIARLGRREGSLLELLVMIVVLVAIVVGIFIYGLNIPFQLGPW